jgi:hypothetical protein
MLRLRRSLMEGLPARSEFLQQQRRNMDTFAEDNKEDFDAMEYFPWTSPPAGRSGFRGHKFKAAPAKAPLTGLIGVFTEQKIDAAPTPRRLIPYGGMLVTPTLYERFSKQYFCPTGLQLDSVECEDKGKTAKMLLIGDPTSLGALINDGGVGREERQ